MLATHGESGHKTGQMSLPILYSFRRCPYAMRARLAILASGTVCELREVKLSAKPAALIEASPKATVPVLVQPDGAVIAESLEIMRWCLGQSDPAGWLARDDPTLIAANDGPFKRNLDAYKYPDRQRDPGVHRAAGLTFLTELDSRLAGQGQLCGAAPGLADMAIMPFVRQFAAIDPAWFAAQPLPQLKPWLAGHLKSALFAAIMVRFAPWQAGDAPVFFG
jgi:glutathione S-transferase